jgi:hypothetical protein
MHDQFQHVNPLREPSWRFQRVLDIVERDTPGRCTKQDDEAVREYRRFVVKLRRQQSGEGQMTIFPKFPGLFLAHLLHHQADKEWRWLIQARILSGEDNEAIASRMSMLPSAVDWYEKIFFNVRDRLDATDYIVKQVIGKPEERKATAREGAISDFQEQISYKLFGYYGGPLVLDIMFGGFAKMPMPERPERTAEWLDTTWSTLLRRKSASAVRHLEINKFNIMQLMEMQLRLIEVAKDSGGSDTEFERNVQGLLNEIPWELSEVRAKRQAEEMDQDLFVPTAIEPRSDELMQIAMGRVPRQLLTDRKLQILPAGSQATSGKKPSKKPNK